MNLDYAIDRLYATGWFPAGACDIDRMPDGRAYPSVQSIEREFALAGLQLSIKQNVMFNCYRATWGPAGDPLTQEQPDDERHGTVVGTSQCEAAVYALAQLRAAERQAVLA